MLRYNSFVRSFVRFVIVTCARRDNCRAPNFATVSHRCHSSVVVRLTLDFYAGLLEFSVFGVLVMTDGSSSLRSLHCSEMAEISAEVSLVTIGNLTKCYLCSMSPFKLLSARPRAGAQPPHTWHTSTGAHNRPYSNRHLCFSDRFIDALIQEISHVCMLLFTFFCMSHPVWMEN